jgi:ATP-dependent DNA ligase
MKRLSSPQPKPRKFVEAMECLPVAVIPEGPNWTYEIKLDGFRLEAIRSGGETTLYSWNQNILNKRFPYIAKALSGLPTGTILDGELVALDPEGRPSFNLLQNFRSAESHIIYYVFDILAHKHRDLTQLPLVERREILQTVVTRQVRCWPLCERKGLKAS